MFSKTCIIKIFKKIIYLRLLHGFNEEKTCIPDFHISCFKTLSEELNNNKLNPQVVVITLLSHFFKLVVTPLIKKIIKI